jgi:hypothetical protein
VRHAARDFADSNREDLLANATALKHGSETLSAYLLREGTKLWVIMEAKGVFDICKKIPDRQTYYLQDKADYYTKKSLGKLP